MTSIYCTDVSTLHWSQYITLTSIYCTISSISCSFLLTVLLSVIHSFDFSCLFIRSILNTWILKSYISFNEKCMEDLSKVSIKLISHIHATSDWWSCSWWFRIYCYIILIGPPLVGNKSDKKEEDEDLLQDSGLPYEVSRELVVHTGMKMKTWKMISK